MVARIWLIAGALELLADSGIDVKVVRIGLPDRFVEQGSQAELRSRYGLDAEGIACRVREVLAEVPGQ